MVRQESIREGYCRKIDACAGELATRRRQENWLGRLRVATFVQALGLIYYGLFHAAASGIWLVAGAIFVATFIALVRVHERVIRRAEELRERLRINETQLARLDRDWDHVPACNIIVPCHFEQIANDLDLFGHASLYQLISQAHTSFGRETLRDWLLSPAPPAEIADRQQAISFLAPADTMREEVALRGRMLSADGRGTLAFVEWAESRPILASRVWLKWLTRLSSGLFVVVMVAALGGLIGSDVAFLALTAVVGVHLVVLFIYGGRTFACSIVSRPAATISDNTVLCSRPLPRYRPTFGCSPSFICRWGQRRTSRSADWLT